MLKKVTFVAQYLLGALLLFASTTFLFKLITPEPPTGDMATMMAGFMATKYLMHLAKIVELVCAIAFLSNRYVAFAAVLLAPIAVNIFCIHAFVDPKGLPVAIFVVAATALIGWHHFDKYRPMFAAK